MGKKRKKSKGRKKKRRRQKKSAVDAPPGTADESHADGEDPVDEVIDLDEDLDDPEALAELVAAAADLDERSPEEDEADPGDASGGDSPDADDDPTSGTAADRGEEDAADPAEDAPDPAEDAPDLAEDAADPTEDTADRTEDDADSTEDDVDLAEDDADPTEDAADRAEDDALPSEDDAPDEDEDDAPLIGPAALVALSEFRDEGVATVPEELVLELGEATSAEERDRLLAAALAHVEMQDAIYRVPLESGTTRRWKGVLAAVIFVMALFLAGLPPAFLVPEAPSPVTTDERLRGIRMALLLQAEQVDAFQVREDRLPTSLAEVETALPGIRLVRSSNRLYQLVAYTPDGDAVVYDSASPDSAFAEVGASWKDRRDES